MKQNLQCWVRSKLQHDVIKCPRHCVTATAWCDITSWVLNMLKHIFSKSTQQELWWMLFFCKKFKTTSLTSCQPTVKLGLGSLASSPFSFDLTPSDFHLFRPLKEAHHEIQFKDEAMKKSMHQWLKEHEHAFYHNGMHSLDKRWSKTEKKKTEIILKSDKLIIKSVDFMLCKLHLIIFTIKKERKNRSIILYTDRTL